MIKTLLTAFLLGLAGLVGLATAEPVPRATFTEVTEFGDNPSESKLYLYVPSNLSDNPPVVVGIHWCHGSATAYYSGTQWATLSEQYGFVVIYPESPFLDEDGCWDVASTAALTHNGGGDSNAIANMVTFVLEEYAADSSRVYVTGISSGAMMTNVMVATYPELFEAGIAYSGVPAGCFMSVDDIPDYWNGTCAEGNSVAPQSYWVDTARAMYPGFTGTYPRLQIYHGDSDEILNFNNYGETMKMWTGLMGYDFEPAQTLADTPFSPFTKYVFGERLEGIVGAGVPHNIQHNETEDARWFGLDSTVVETTTSVLPTTTTEGPTSTSTDTTSTVTSTTTTTSEPPATQSHWGQCGGIGWNGATTCEEPYGCQELNDWYFQCL